MTRTILLCAAIAFTFACGSDGGSDADTGTDVVTDPFSDPTVDTSTDPGTDPGTDTVTDTSTDTVVPPPSAAYDCVPDAPSGDTYWVATDGSDETGDGSETTPWATITNALDNVPDGCLILVKSGLYEGRIRMRGNFTTGVEVRSEVPYQARLRHTGTVMTFYEHGDGVRNITIEGFDIAHTGSGAEALVVHIDGGGTGVVSDITVRNNVLHDSHNNDILKINNGISGVVVERNLFFNQQGSDEHIDINSAENVLVQDNIFMSDFEASGRVNGSDTSAFIVIKDSNQDTDRFTGSHDITVRRNVFMSFQGSSGSAYLLCGEDGHPIFETYDLLAENNLFIGNFTDPLRAAFGLQGCRDVVFRSNTVTGDLPGRAFAMRMIIVGDNPVNENVSYYNNIWSDPTGTMGALDSSGTDDFSDTTIGETASFVLDNNLYYNGGDSIPTSTEDLVNHTDDPHAVLDDPVLADPALAVNPHFDSSTHTFADGSSNICEAFTTLVTAWAAPGSGSGALDAADPAQAPVDDITGTDRGSSPDIGAYEAR